MTIKKILERMFSIAVLASMIFSFAALVTPLNGSQADVAMMEESGPGWAGCDDGNPDPGNRSGCSVRFCGTISGSGGTYGCYEYTCGGTKTYCLYRY